MERFDEELRGWFPVIAPIVGGFLIAAMIVVAWRQGWILDLMVWRGQLGR